MSALFCFLLASIFGLTTSYTTITAGSATKFTEDWAYSSTTADITDPADSWWYKASGGADIGARTDTFSGNKIWGWWRWDENDPGNQMIRDFKCSSYSTVYLSYDVYFCIDNNAASITSQYYSRLAIGASPKKITIQYDKSGDYSSWSTLSNGPCGDPVKKATVTDIFETTSTYPFTITITKEMNNAIDETETWRSNYNYQLTAFNNMEIRCEKIVTNSPSPSPTKTTSDPSISPTKFPTPSPTSNPTPAPTAQPTRPPVTIKPSLSPITLDPTLSPTDVPSKTPTESPTEKPTEAPTKKPTGKPSKAPTKRPTKQRSIGEQFSNAFGVTENEECYGSWIECNRVVFIILVVIIVVMCCYWILGAAWYKRRQDNRPLPSHLAGKGVEMGGTATHATANKWKSAWELEQEQGGGGDW